MHTSSSARRLKASKPTRPSQKVLPPFHTPAERSIVHTPSKPRRTVANGRRQPSPIPQCPHGMSMHAIFPGPNLRQSQSKWRLCVGALARLRKVEFAARLYQCMDHGPTKQQAYRLGPCDICVGISSACLGTAVQEMTRPTRPASGT